MSNTEQSALSHVLDEPSQANAFFAARPEAANLNYCCQPTTALVGVAPFRALKGAPGHLIEVDDMLRPQSTLTDNSIVRTANIDRNADVSCTLPIRVQDRNPISSRAAMRNAAHDRLYRK